MTKFLNESGFRRIIKTIKNALSLKADKTELPLVVIYDGTQCDTSIADIYAAFLAGRNVEMNYGYLFKLSLVQCSEEGAIFSANFGDQSIGIKGTISNGVDTWEFSLVDLQERLTSGTNIKTINNTSLLGSGNISIEPNEIASITTTESSASGGNNTVTINTTDGTSKTFNVKNGKDGADGVSLGEIALVQTTGDSEESVMSQKAVTEYGRKVTAEDLDGTSEWIRAKLTEEGWEFGKYVGTSGNTVADNRYCATPYFELGHDVVGHKLIIYYNLSANGGICFTCYDANKTKTDYYIYIGDTSRTLNSLSNNFSGSVYFRMTLNPSKLSECYVYDVTTGTYIWRGDDYLKEFCINNNITYGILKSEFISQEVGDSETKVISQKITTDYINQHIEQRGTSFFFENPNANYMYSFPLTTLQQTIMQNAEILTFRFAYRGSPNRTTFFRSLDGSFIISVASSNGTTSVNGVSVLGYNNTDGTVLSFVVDRVKGIVKVYKENNLLNTVTNSAFIMNSFPVSDYFYFVSYHISCIFSISVFDFDIFQGGICTSYNRDAQGYSSPPVKVNNLSSYRDWSTANVFDGYYPAWTKTDGTDGTHYTISASSTATDKSLGFTKRPNYFSTGITQFFVTDYYFTVVSGTISVPTTSNSYPQRLYNATTGAIIADTDMNSVTQGSYILRTWGDSAVYTKYAVINWVSGDTEVVLTQFKYKPVVCVVDIKGDVVANNMVYDTASKELKKFYEQNGQNGTKARSNLLIQTSPLRYIVYDNVSYNQAFVGQMKIYNNKIYIADNSYTWKQINNS